MNAPPSAWWSYLPIGEFVRRVNAGVAAHPRAVQATSWYRDPGWNASVGGHKYSQHLLGLAVDLVSSDMLGLKRALEAQGLIAINEGDHVHAQAWPAGTVERLLRVG